MVDEMVDDEMVDDERWWRDQSNLILYIYMLLLIIEREELEKYTSGFSLIISTIQTLSIFHPIKYLSSHSFIHHKQHLIYLISHSFSSLDACESVQLSELNLMKKYHYYR